MLIRQASSDEFDKYNRVIETAGLHARVEVLRFCFRHPDIRCYVALVDGTVAGTGCATFYHGGTGWIGYISVLPEYRRRGIGRALAEYGEEWLLARGARSIILLATREGERLYEKIGYVKGIDYIALEGVGPAQDPGGCEISRATGALATATQAGLDLRPAASGDWARILALDRCATGELRENMLSAMTTVKVALRAGTVTGFHALGPWGTGPIIASDRETGSVLLNRSIGRCPGKRMRVHVPSANEDALSQLERSGFIESSRSAYMVKGPWPEPYNPQMIWSMFGFSLG